MIPYHCRLGTGGALPGQPDTLTGYVYTEIRKCKEIFELEGICVQVRANTAAGGNVSGGLNPRDFPPNNPNGQGRGEQRDQGINRGRDEGFNRGRDDEDDDVEPQGGWKIFLFAGFLLPGILLWQVCVSESAPLSQHRASLAHCGTKHMHPRRQFEDYWETFCQASGTIRANISVKKHEQDGETYDKNYHIYTSSSLAEEDSVSNMV
jgi:hypothetical protein